MLDVMDYHKWILPGYYMFDENETIEYNHHKALDYWLKIKPNNFLYTLAFEMLSINGHAKAYINSWKKDSFILLPEHQASIMHSMLNICNIQSQINYLLDAIYLYAANEYLPNHELRFPSEDSEYSNNLPEWYKKNLIEFLLTILPPTQEKIFFSYTEIKKIREESGLDKIILSATTLSDGRKNILTLDSFSNGLFKASSILKEMISLTMSYTQNYKMTQ